jgi:hypothetical protein
MCKEVGLGCILMCMFDIFGWWNALAAVIKLIQS